MFTFSHSNQFWNQFITISVPLEGQHFVSVYEQSIFITMKFNLNSDLWELFNISEIWVMSLKQPSIHKLILLEQNQYDATTLCQLWTYSSVGWLLFSHSNLLLVLLILTVWLVLILLN